MLDRLLRPSSRRRRGIGVLLISALALGGCAIEPGSVEDGEGIIGTYVVNGVDPHGTEYTGTVVIAPASENSSGGDGTYAVEWLITASLQQGVGTLVGDIFTVDWHTVEDMGNDASGTAVYVVEDDGMLTGSRSVDGLDEPGTEEIFPEA